MQKPIAVTPGEASGIGPDLIIQLASELISKNSVVIADADLLRERAALLGLRLPTTLRILHVPLARKSQCGQLDSANAAYVLETLQKAGEGCLRGDFSAVVTGPVHKGIINKAGIPFSGQTEFFAQLSHSLCPVMMLAAGNFRVALATTHLPLSEVPKAITSKGLEKVLRVLVDDLKKYFALVEPTILVCGLNPHAGEGGYLGREEIDIIQPTLTKLRSQGFKVEGPLPADTLFTEKYLKQADAVLAMYHDQGLPVIKHSQFGKTVNVTLGLPFLRTSVDHGTALELAGTGKADPSSLRSALALTLEILEKGEDRYA